MVKTDNINFDDVDTDIPNDSKPKLIKVLTSFKDKFVRTTR